MLSDLYNAFHKMTYSKNGNYIKSAKDYEYCRHFISLYNSGNISLNLLELS